MSKVKIEGNASGTGTLTIAAPNTNTDRTLTLPDSTGTIVAASGGVLPALDGSNLTGVSAGKVLQVVKTGNFNVTSTSIIGSWVATNCTLNITPSSANSKILVLGSIGLKKGNATSGLMRKGLRLLRGSTVVWNTASGGEVAQVRSNVGEYNTMNSVVCLDSPASTSQLTYTFEIKQHDAGYINLEQSGIGSGFALLEIAG